MHSFHPGGGRIARIGGGDLPSIMQRAFWKKPKTAWRYLRLLEAVIPSSVGNSMVRGVTEDEYEKINSFPLSEQSRGWEAFHDMIIYSVKYPTGATNRLF